MKFSLGLGLSVLALATPANAELCPHGDGGAAWDWIAQTAFNEIGTLEQDIYSGVVQFNRCFAANRWDWNASAGVDLVRTETGTSLGAQEANVYRLGFGTRRWFQGEANGPTTDRGWIGATGFIAQENYRLPLYSPGSGGSPPVLADERIATSAMLYAGREVLGNGFPGNLPQGLKIGIDGSLTYSDFRSPDTTSGQEAFRDNATVAGVSGAISHAVGAASRFEYRLSYNRNLDESFDVGRVELSWIPQVGGRDVAIGVRYSEGSNEFAGWGLSVGTRY